MRRTALWPSPHRFIPPSPTHSFPPIPSSLPLTHKMPSPSCATAFALLFCSPLFLLLLSFADFSSSQNVSAPLSEGNPTEVNAAKKYFENKVWGCVEMGGTCFKEYNNLGNLVGTCPIVAEGWICKEGYYEALDGVCREEPKRSLAIGVRKEGCSREEKPEGPSELGCLETEATCTRNRDETARCPEEEKVNICRKGYHRVPGNRCVPNEEKPKDAGVFKPGCLEYLKNSCAPNQTFTCNKRGITPLEASCQLTRTPQEPPSDVSPLLASGDCTPSCTCRRDSSGIFVRESQTGRLSRCILQEDCEKKAVVCGENAHWEDCPHSARDNYCLELRVNSIDTHCANYTQMEVCEEPCNRKICIGEKGRCVCDQGFVRHGYRCISLEACRNLLNPGPCRFGSLSTATTIFGHQQNGTAPPNAKTGK